MGNKSNLREIVDIQYLPKKYECRIRVKLKESDPKGLETTVTLAVSCLSLRHQKGIGGVPQVDLSTNEIVVDKTAFTGKTDEPLLVKILSIFALQKIKDR